MISNSVGLEPETVRPRPGVEPGPRDPQSPMRAVTLPRPQPIICNTHLNTSIKDVLRMFSLGVMAAFFSVFGWTTYYLLAKKAAPIIGNKKLALIITGAGAIPMAIILLILGFQWPGALSFTLAIAGGITIAIANFLNYKSMETEQVTNVAALGVIPAVMITLFGVFVLHNPLTSIELASIILVFLCVFMVMSNEKININKRLIPSLIGNLLWGTYWLIMIISITSSNTFQVQMLTSRLVGVAALAVFIYFIGIKSKASGKVWRRGAYVAILLIAALSGLVDGSADGVFGLTVHLNVVAEGGTISALSPILIYIVAYFIYGDRLTKLQLLGMIGIVIGALGLALF